jgi:hypothetical protein
MCPEHNGATVSTNGSIVDDQTKRESMKSLMLLVCALLWFGIATADAAGSKPKATQQEETRCYMLGLIYTVIGANRDAGREIGTALYEVRNIDEWDNNAKLTIAVQMYNSPKYKYIEGGSMGEHMKKTCLKHPAFIDLTDPDSP